MYNHAMEPYGMYPSPYPQQYFMPPRPPRRGLSAAAIIGIVIAVLLVLALVITLPIVLLTGDHPDPPPPRPAGPWSTWGPCSVTCGSGLQNRYRQCYEEVGCDNYQTQSCVNPICVEPCNLQCYPGTRPDKNCGQCVCNVVGYLLVTGQVTNEDKIPLAYATVKYAIFPVERKVKTGLDGRFVLCLPRLNTLTVSAPGYLDTTVNALASNMMVKLEEIEALHITEHPENKHRLLSQGARLCCKAEGNPPPGLVSYQWYKNDQMIDGEEQETLSLSNLQESNEGLYKCVAENELDDIAASNTAYVQVEEEEDDYCPVTPMEAYKKLPPGCTFNGEDSVSVGMCSGPCPGYVMSCRDSAEEEVRCCQSNSSQTISVTLDCENGRQLPWEYTEILACDCRKCPNQEVLVSGKVRSAYSYLPIEGAIVQRMFYDEHNNLVSVDGDESDYDGSFRFDIPVGEERVLLHISAEDHISRTEVLTLAPDLDMGIVRNVYLLKEPQSVSFYASEPAALPFGDPNRMGYLQFTPSSFYNAYNTPMADDEKVFVCITAVDPREPNAHKYLLELLTDDENGVEVGMGTYGIIYVSLKDSLGRPVTTNGPIEVHVMRDVLRNDVYDGLTDVNAYLLNSQAKWEYRSNFVFPSSRRKRDSHTGVAVAEFQEIASDMIINIDREERLCWIKVRAKKGDEPITQGIVHVLALDPPGEELEEQGRPVSNYGTAYLGPDGACVRTICGDTFNSDRGKIWVTDFAGQYIPPSGGLPAGVTENLNYQVDGNYAIIDLEPRTSAPLYDSRMHCFSADKSDLSLDFSKMEPTTSFMSITISMLPFEAPRDQRPEMAFYQQDPVTHKYTVCFAKLRMPATLSQIYQDEPYSATNTPTADNIGGNTEYDEIGKTFGYLEVGFEASNFDYRTACVELKPSGKAESGIMVGVNNKVSVSSSAGTECGLLLNGHLIGQPVAEVDPNPGSEGVHNVQTFLDGAFLDSLRGSEYGFYCYEDEALDEAKHVAHGLCNAGSDNMPENVANGMNYAALACLDWCDPNPCDTNFICTSATPSSYTCEDPTPP